MTCYVDNTVILKKNDSTFCKIHLFGATITSYVNKNVNCLFLSSKANFDGRSAIRGGIPVVFPNFGPWECGPQHGFARISWWKLEQPPTVNEMGDVSARLLLEDNADTRQMWPYKFRMTLFVELLDDGLKVTLEVLNKSYLSDMSFTCLLHTYFNVSDVTRTKLVGFKNSRLNDKINLKKEIVSGDEISFNGLVDCIYHDTPMVHEICREGSCIRLTKENFPDTVVWNPWEEKASKMADMGDLEWKKMLCVEAGRVVKPVTLKPLQSYQASQKITIINH